MSQIRTIIIDTSQLFREGLQRLLDPVDFEVCGLGDSLAGVQRIVEKVGPADLVIFDFSTADIDEDLQTLRNLRNAYPGIRLILLSNILSQESVSRLIGVRLDGYLPKNLSPDALNYSLNLIILGINVFPPELMSPDASRSHGNQDSEHAVELETLSRRELQVLRCLTAGFPNKVIAHDLRIKEATVKVHLKSILRKLTVSNRTQAAVIGRQHGLDDAEIAAVTATSIV